MSNDSKFKYCKGRDCPTCQYACGVSGKMVGPCIGFVLDSKANEQSAKNEKIKEILKTEYSDEFNKLCKHRVVEGFYKYGPIATNFGEGFTDAIKNIELCLLKIKETGNTEYFCDISNYAMYAWMYPTKGQYFKASPTEESAGRSGGSVRDMEKEGYI